MTFKGTLINDSIVMFGSQVDEKIKSAINKACPDANSIIASLPESAFIPEPDFVEEKKVEKKKLSKKEIAELRKKKREERLAKKAKANIIKKNKIYFNVENILLTEVKKDYNMSLETNLDDLLSDAKPKTAPVQESLSTGNQILDLFYMDEDSPSLDQISAWKDQYGKNSLHVMSFGENDNYLYHHLTRGEWRKIKEVMKVVRESENGEEIEERLKEKVIASCVLFPKIDESWLENCKAGALDALYQMILVNSGFLTPQQAMLLTAQIN